MVHDVYQSYIAGLVNARAAEAAAIRYFSRQLRWLDSFPDMECALRRHTIESEHQRDRLDVLLDDIAPSAPRIDSVTTGLMGHVTALTLALPPDQVMTNVIANYAIEHFEIATYRCLITLADLAGHSSAMPSLRQSLLEEERMANWWADHLDATTHLYMEMQLQGQTAGV